MSIVYLFYKEKPLFLIMQNNGFLFNSYKS